MKSGRGGMGSHKHGVSGNAGKSPRFRHLAKLEAERCEVKAKGKIIDPANSVGELFKRKKRI
jgi:hypothetical protein